MRVLTESEDARIDTLVARRSLGHPVAHLVAQREFYGRMFSISPDVLIPRPETETLVEAALARLGPGGHVLDLGTGSGAIAVTLACERPEATVVATDASEASLAVANANAKTLGARIEFLQGSWYAPVAARRFDMIVANPPYVADGDPHLSQGDLRFEPAAALTDGSPDGLASIRAVVTGARDHLEPGGWLMIEHGYNQEKAVKSLFEAAGFTEYNSIDDLAGIPRVGLGVAPSGTGLDKL
jgi:release factor glutamine methyltransferase